MLLPYCEPEISIEDRKLFDTLVPFDHWTRRADKHIDFLELRKSLEPLFSQSKGRPAIEPVLFVKIELIMFHVVLGQAREYGLVKDRLRLKDATHVLADIAIPAGLQLVAQARNKLLTAAEPVDADDNPTWKSHRLAAEIWAKRAKERLRTGVCDGPSASPNRRVCRGEAGASEGGASPG